MLAPLLVLLPPRLGISGVWYAFPISDGVVFRVVVVFLRRQYAALRRAEIREPSRAATAGA